MPGSLGETCTATPAPSSPSPPTGSDGLTTATVDLTLAGRRLRLELTVPSGPIRTRQMLPVLQSLTESMVEAGTRAAAERGERISCAKGCASCCRQLVPITEMEAFHLRDLIAGLPEPRRTEVRKRYDEARVRLDQAGLLDTIRNPENLNEKEVDEVGLAYFRLGLACPFLEEESCSIHVERPLACRQYLVTSPASNCARPEVDTIRGVPLPANVAQAAARLGQATSTSIVPHVPLILALEWAESHSETPAERVGPQILQELFERLASKKEKIS